MITILIDSQKDTAFLRNAYEGVVDNVVFINPTREEAENFLKEHPNERVMLMGHGGPSGLFSHDWKGYVIDHNNVHLLKDREVIGIWCWAKHFGKREGLKGFFTSMFISNHGEYRSFFPTGVNWSEQVIFDEITNFAREVASLLRSNTPLENWVNVIQSNGDYKKNFVKFNYEALEYYDGTQSTSQNEVVSASTSTSYSAQVEEMDEEDKKASESYEVFREYLSTDDVLNLTLEEIIEYAYTEGFKAGRAF